MSTEATYAPSYTKYLRGDLVKVDDSDQLAMVLADLGGTVTLYNYTEPVSKSWVKLSGRRSRENLRGYIATLEKGPADEGQALLQILRGIVEEIDTEERLAECELLAKTIAEDKQKQIADSLRADQLTAEFMEHMGWEKPDAIQPTFDPDNRYFDKEGDAFEFLGQLRPQSVIPGGLHTIAAIRPNQRGLVAGYVWKQATRGPSPFMALMKRAGASSSGLYYHVNQSYIRDPRGGFIREARRASRHDIEAIHYVHADIDGDKDGKKHNWADPEVRKERIRRIWGALVKIYDEHGVWPAFINFTGGGVHVLYRLKTPIELTDVRSLPKIGEASEEDRARFKALREKRADEIESVERISRALLAAVEQAEPELGTLDRGGGTIDHLLRLPGFVNYPDDGKRERGRVPVRAHNLYSAKAGPSGYLGFAGYDLEDFSSLIGAHKEAAERPKPKPAHDGSAALSDEERADTLGRARKALSYVPAGHPNKEITLNGTSYKVSGYDVWALKIGMALHDLTGGSHEGQAVWDGWSRGHPKFSQDGQDAKWDSFRSSGVGIGTLFEIAKQCGCPTELLRSQNRISGEEAFAGTKADPIDPRQIPGSDDAYGQPLGNGATGETPAPDQAGPSSEAQWDDIEAAEQERSEASRKKGEAAQAAYDAVVSELEGYVKGLDGLMDKGLAILEYALTENVIYGLAALRVLRIDEYAEKENFLRTAGVRMTLFHEAFDPVLKQLKRKYAAAKKALADSGTKTIPKFMAELNANHALIIQGGRSVIIYEKPGEQFVDFWRVDAFNHKYANKKLLAGDDKTVSIAKLWMEHDDRREFDRVDFCPGENPPGVFNLWRGFEVKPSQAGSCELFKSHLLDNVCQGNKELFAWLWGWLADMFQNPGLKPGVCVTLKSRAKGTGKSIVGDIFRTAVGRRHAVKVSRQKELVGDFNAHFECALFAQIEESVFDGNAAAVNTFNDLITSPTVGIERKGIDRIEVKSVTRFLVTSNSEKAISASSDERRHAVFEVGTAQAQNHDYFRAIFSQMEDGGYGRLVHELQTYDYSGIDPTIAPRTDALLAMKLQALDAFGEWWHGALKSGDLWGDEPENAIAVRCGELFESFQNHEKHYRHLSKPTSKEELGRRLKAIVPGSKRARGTREASGSQPWQYEIPGLDVCRKSFDTYIGHRVPWNEH